MQPVNSINSSLKKNIWYALYGGIHTHVCTIYICICVCVCVCSVYGFSTISRNYYYFKQKFSSKHLKVAFF